ncbi:MAG: polysaccharide lyase 8 family protein, partial [Clostridia bacterium]|nr:polysaccharide lyase 8 family protein [Clostridia bacterium]
IRNSLEYMYNNYYGEQHITDISYINWVKNSNWWYWEIGISSYVADILMILSDDLTQAEINKYLIPVDYFIPEITMTACNRLWVGKVYFASAILQGKTADALVALEKLYEIFDYVTYGDGFYTDGSFIQHNHHPYTGGYGASLFEELTDFMLVLESTVFTIPYEVAKAHYDWVFDSFEPVIYKKNLMASVNGREVVRSTTTENTRFVKFLVSLIRMAKYAPENERERIIPLLKYYIENSDVSSYIGAVPINLIDFVYQIREDASIEARSDYEIFKVFGNMDRVVQHRPDYSVAFALSSTRVFKYEAINNENVKGWYQGDGMVYIYTDGYDFSNAFYNYADPYKMPGTTVSAEMRNEDNMNGGPALGVLGSSAFSGGVECGKYGVAAMILGYEENPYYNTDITARKSYFAFDNEIICIGSGIKESTTGKEIFTTVENRFWNSGDVFKVDGAAKSGSGSAKAKYMHFTNMGGYVFDGATEVKYKKYTNTHSFLEITVSHGVSPTNGSYFFVYLPTATDAETKAYSESLSERITVISQTDAVHAVRDNDIGVTGYVFYEAGSCNGVTVSAPCIVMVSEDSVSVSDPTHKLDSITVSVDGTGMTFETAELCGATVTKSR